MGVDSCCVNSSFAFPDVKYCLRRIALLMPFLRSRIKQTFIGALLRSIQCCECSFILNIFHRRELGIQQENSTEKILHQRRIRPQSNTGQSSGSTPPTCFDLHHMGAVHGGHRRDKSPQSSLQRTWPHYWPTFLVEYRPKTTDMANKNCEVHISINILFLIKCSDFHEGIFK